MHTYGALDPEKIAALSLSDFLNLCQWAETHQQNGGCRG